MDSVEKEAKIAKTVLRFLEDRSLAQWDLIDTIFTEVKQMPKKT